MNKNIPILYAMLTAYSVKDDLPYGPEDMNFGVLASQGYIQSFTLIRNKQSTDLYKKIAAWLKENRPKDIIGFAVHVKEGKVFLVKDMFVFEEIMKFEPVIGDKNIDNKEIQLHYDKIKVPYVEHLLPTGKNLRFANPLLVPCAQDIVQIEAIRFLLLAEIKPVIGVKEGDLIMRFSPYELLVRPCYTASEFITRMMTIPEKSEVIELYATQTIEREEPNLREYVRSVRWVTEQQIWTSSTQLVNEDKMLNLTNCSFVNKVDDLKTFGLEPIRPTEFMVDLAGRIVLN